jgi:hypothetical protein
VDRWRRGAHLRDLLEAGQGCGAEGGWGIVSKAAEDAALDWLLDRAMAQDGEARDHYFHIIDGEKDTCMVDPMDGRECRYQGEAM